MTLHACSARPHVLRGEFKIELDDAELAHGTVGIAFTGRAEIWAVALDAVRSQCWASYLRNSRKISKELKSRKGTTNTATYQWVENARPRGDAT